jgi:DNA gyrase subunit A
LARRKDTDIHSSNDDQHINASIPGAGTVVEQVITDTLEINYMPYAMSVILSRAIPEIDGFKPSHRKLLYTMYKMNLINGDRMKSANIVGRTMQLNPHGDAAIYDTMVRLSKGYEALLHPFVDSKGNFGKAYSRDMSYAASRYTEAKLEKICNELFSDIDKDTVDFIDNYDATMKEPVLLPVTFPTVLVNLNSGIAVGMASQICSFNLKEVCDTTIALIRDNDADIMETLIAPDFSGGGLLIYDREAMRDIYSTGRGGFKVRAKYSYDKSANCIDITEIPPTTTSEQIIERIIERVKSGDIKEISDARDETDKGGLKITLDLKRGTDPEKFMAKLFRMTPLEDTFSCNFNILISGMPKVMGIREILTEWIAFRSECIRRRVFHELTAARDKLHLLKGLKKILLDIDKAIKIVRETAEESEVVTNLMIGFGIDEIQAEYVAEIKLRHLNKEYILNRLTDIEDLEKDIADKQDILDHKERVNDIIISELKAVTDKYSKPRNTKLIYANEITASDDTDEPVPDYAVNIFFTRDGYFKKITPQSLRMSGEHKLKEGDEITQTLESTNNSELLVFTDKGQVYKSRVCDFQDSKTSVLGDYLPSALDFEDDEKPVYLAVFEKYEGYMLFFFENGKLAKVDMNSYETKTNRKKLLKAFSLKSPLAGAFYTKSDDIFLLTNSDGKRLIVNTGLINSKNTKDTLGVSVMTMRKGRRLISAQHYERGTIEDESRYMSANLPATGAFPKKDGNDDSQLTF